MKPDPQYAGEGAGSDVASLWMTDKPVAEVSGLWKKLAAVYPQTGLWPLVLEPLAADNQDRPWTNGELVPGDVSAVDGVDPAEVLSTGWEQLVSLAGGDPALKPFGTKFAGLAGAEQRCVGDIGEVVQQIDGPFRLGLVAVRRPADALTRIGWLGPANYEQDIATYSAVLRSWEDRFGAYVVDIGFDTLTIAAERPPERGSDRNLLAAEMTALDPDLVLQGVDSVGALAPQAGSTTWKFWWD